MKALAGKKTYVCAAAAGLITVAQLLGFIDAETYAGLMGLVGAGGLAALRGGVSKGEVR